MENVTASRLPFKAQWSYMYGEYAYTYTVMVFFTYFVYFLTDDIGINPSTAGTIYMIGMVWDSITDPLIGVITDNTKWKSGRRRTPFMKLSILPMCFFTILMFTVVNFDGIAKFIFYSVAVIGYYTFATIYYISYQSLAAEMTNNLDDRANIMSIRAGMISFGTVIASAGTLFIINLFNSVFTSVKIGWAGAIIILCIPGLILAKLCFSGTMPYERVIKEDSNLTNEKTSVAQILKETLGVFKNKAFVFLLIALFTCCVPAYGSTTTLIYYMTYYTSLNEWETSFAFVLQGVGGVITVSFVSWVLRKYERKTSFIILMGIYAISFVMLFFLSPGNKYGFYIAMIVWGYGWMSVWSVTYSLIADATVIDEYLTGEPREGTYFGIVQLGLKIGAGLIIWISSNILEYSGYIANQAQSETSLQAIRFVNSILPTSLFIISLFIMSRYPINRKIYDTIVESINLRKQGLDYKKISGLTVGSGKVNVIENLIQENKVKVKEMS